MDLSSLYTAEAHDAGAEMCVKGPDGKETDFYITLAGIDSAIWRALSKERQRALIAASIKGEEIEIDPDSQPNSLAKATLDWRGLVNNDEPVEFSVDAAAQLYKNAPYIMDQVDQFIGDRANFTGG